MFIHGAICTMGKHQKQAHGGTEWLKYPT